MRQTYVFRLCHSPLKLILCVMLLVLGCFSSTTYADVPPSSLAVNTEYVGGTAGKRINAGGRIRISATWQGDSYPFYCRFTRDGSILATDNGTLNQSSYDVNPSNWGDTGSGGGSVGVEVSDSAGRSLTGSSQNFVIDLTAPNVGVTLSPGPYGPESVITVSISTDEECRVTSVTCNGVNGQVVGAENPGQGFNYTLDLKQGTFVNNTQYTITVTVKDTSEPEGTANQKTQTATFSLGTSTTGTTSITTPNTGTFTNAQNLNLTGQCPNGATKVVIMENEAQVSQTTPNGTSWDATINNVGEDVHNYVAVSYDELNQEISRSGPITVTVDRSAPSQPTFETEGIPTQTNLNSQDFLVTVSGYDSEVSTPVTLQAYVNGSAVGQTYNVTNQGNPVRVTVPLSDGTNVITFKAKDASGNESEASTSFTITKNTNASSAVSSVVVDSYSIPVPSEKMLGAGSHQLTVNFSQVINNTVLPTVEIECGGGSKITVTCNWVSEQQLSGAFTIPSNGGTSIDGAAKIVIKDVKDTYGNTIDEYNQDSAFVIDSTPPTSTINGDTNIYISGNNQTVNLSGTCDDGENGSGIEYLTLYMRDAQGQETPYSIPLQSGSPSPWTWNNLDVSTLNEETYTLVTAATDRAQPANTEIYSGKAGITITVDKTPPEVTRISLNNTGIDINSYEQPLIIASDVTRIVAVASDTKSGPDLTNPEFIFTITGPNGEITGEKTNNGVDTIYFDFPVLTAYGTYNIVVQPIDKAGNKGEVASRSFTINRSAPDSAEFHPTNNSIVNETEENIAQSQVKVELTSTGGGVTPSYTNSTISVKYNGIEVGEKQYSEEALIAKLHNASVSFDMSHDGKYYITVVPFSSSGISGNPITSQFTLDTIPPLIAKSDPLITTKDESWYGLDKTEFTLEATDAPKEILELAQTDFYQSQDALSTGVTFANIKTPTDSTWYNGSGSGINYEVSTFTWTLDSAVSDPPTHIGNTFHLKAPSVPENKDAGVANVTIDVILGDNVSEGASIPNIYKYQTNNVMFDYLAPSINITSTNNLKFCKNTLKVQGTTNDNGSSDKLQVVKAEYQESNDWIGLTVNNLPAKTASISLSLDISNKTDGTYSVKFRSVDRGGNTSQETSYSYIVDRTPPPAPTLTVPLADYTVNKRSQSFKWTTTTDATAYLLQIADDSSFNNILNAQQSTDYPSVLGTVCVTNTSSFSLPKDGTYYWRVASLEKCEDGYNISEFSETRKLIIDTVKPYILSIAPSPSSSNMVSTGMVTFTIRFNEAIDSTVDINATLTSAGGQVMKIEKVSCTGDTWVGTTVIPKNNSSLYDGTATIAVSGGSDVAGNLMANDTTHTIVVNTGPAFTTKLFSNPANEYEITIITKSSESLQSAPSVYVSQNSIKTTVTMNFLKDRFYSGSYKIDKDNPGSAYIKISGTDLYGMVGNSTVEFVVADVNASARLNISASSGRATLKAAAGATYSPTSVYLIDRETLESPFASSSEVINSSLRASAGVKSSVLSTGTSELIGILGLDEVGPSTTKLKKCMLYTADVNGEVIDTSKANKIHIYRQDSKGNWIFQGGELKDYKISTQFSGLGRLALMMDNTAPRMSSISPTNQTKMDTNYPEIKGQFVDNGSGLLVDSFKLYIDDLQVKNVEMDKDGSFTYQVKQPLKEGKHEIKCEVRDKAGNNIVRAVTVDAPALLRVGEFSPYPNPARGNRISFAYNFGAIPDNASLKIYDSAGHIVTKFGSEDFDRISGSIRWDLTNQKGKRIANGTYIYRLEITVGGQKIKKRGKFAVVK